MYLEMADKILLRFRGGFGVEAESTIQCCAWKLLLRRRIQCLPIDMTALCSALKIEIRWYADAADRNDAYSTVVDKKATILMRIGLTEARRRFALAHEVGHILLGHVGQVYPLISCEPDPVNEPGAELDADCFAGELLAPTCVLRACYIQGPEEISALCGLTLKTGAFWWKHMEHMMAVHSYTPFEGRVLRQFEQYICSHRLC